MSQALVCWKCGASLADLSLPLLRTEECRSCRTPLHVCRMCRFFDGSRGRPCLEPVADEVRDRDRANFCGYFQPKAGAWKAGSNATDQARTALESLFGGKP